MREIVLVNFKTRGAAYGIGTYIDELTHCLQQLNVKVTVVEADYRNNEFQMEETPNLRRLLFPLYETANESHYAYRITSFLRLHIKNPSDVIFLFNNYKKDLLEQIKIKFPEAKTIFTVHFFYWTAFLLGDVDRFCLLIEKVDKKPTTKYAHLVQGYLQNKEFLKNVDAVISLSNDTTVLLKNKYGINAKKNTSDNQRIKRHKRGKKRSQKQTAETISHQLG